MRIDLKKYLFIGLKSEQEKFFQQAQEVGIIHFIEPKKGSSKSQPPKEIAEISHAIKILKAQPPVAQEDETSFAMADEIVSEILSLSQKHDGLLTRQEELTLEIARIEPLGHFSQEDLLAIQQEGKRVIQFFSASEGTAEKLDLHEKLELELIYLTTENNLDYFIACNTQRRQYDKMSEIIPEAPLHTLQEELHAITAEIHTTEERLKQLAKYNNYLHISLIHKLDRFHYDKALACADLALDDTLFVIEGWVPKTKVDAVQKLTLKLHLHAEEIAITEKDIIPTCLENQGASRIGEDLVHIYDVPSKDDLDPSLWVLCFFSLFFAMIVGDAGYGLVLLLVGLYVRKKSPPESKLGGRILQLLFILAGAVVAWGILTTSFFGITVAPDHPIRKASLVSWLVEKKTAYHFSKNDDTATHWIQKFPSLKDLHSPVEILSAASTENPETGRITYQLYNTFANDIMIELALFVGVIHLSLSLLRYVRRNPAAIGWVLFLIGGYLYCPKFLNATSLVHFVFGIDKDMGAHSGLILMAGGFGLAVLISLFQHGIVGAVEAIMLVVQIFGDSMSYLRLYALGLSGSLITATVNDLADGMNFVLAALLLIVSHTVNLSLAIMGGVIHGLRLNFLEWYHYSFEGGGKRFNPLKYESKTPST